MTKEELKQEAEERTTKFTDINFNEPDNYGSEKEVGYFSYYTGYLAGAEPREKRIEELEQEIAKLKKQHLDETIASKKIVQGMYDRLVKANKLLSDVYNVAMDNWNDPKWHDQVLRKAREYLKEVE